MRLDAAGLSIREDDLITLLIYCSDNYDKPAYKGKLPAVLFMEESKSFVVCT
jgi:hypothetical protein